MTLLNPAAFKPQSPAPVAVRFLPEVPEHDLPADTPVVDELCRLLARIVTRLRTEPLSAAEGGAQ